MFKMHGNMSTIYVITWAMKTFNIVFLTNKLSDYHIIIFPFDKTILASTVLLNPPSKTKIHVGSPRAFEILLKTFPSSWVHFTCKSPKRSLFVKTSALWRNCQVVI